MALTLDRKRGDEVVVRPSKIRVLLICNDPLARAGLASLISEDDQLLIVGLVTADERLAEEHEIYEPDIAVWDVGQDMHSSDGQQMSQIVGPLQPLIETELPVIALVPSEDVATIVWSTGVAGILPRDTSAEQIAVTIKSVVEDLIVIDLRFRDSLLSVQPPPDLSPKDALTNRELEVLRLLAEGHANRSIAYQLGVSEHTVKFHVNAIMTKLGAQSRTEAVVRATRLGLISL